MVKSVTEMVNIPNTEQLYGIYNKTCTYLLRTQTANLQQILQKSFTKSLKTP